MQTIILLGLTIAGFLIIIDRDRTRTHEERQAHRLELAGLTGRLEQLVRDHAAQLVEMQEAHRAEVQLLCQRIQAPEIAVVQHQQQASGPDHTWPLTDEESAKEAEARMVAVAEIERMEQSGVMS